MQKSNALFAMLLMIASSSVFAGEVDKTVAQKNGWAEYAQQLGKTADTVNKACGSTLSVSYDKTSYPEFDPIKDRTQSACQAGVGALAAICITDAGKDAARKIKTATCRFSTAGTNVKFDGSKLTVNVDPANSSITGKQAGSYSWASALKEIM
jgi:hypothetical protein